MKSVKKVSWQLQPIDSPFKNSAKFKTANNLLGIDLESFFWYTHNKGNKAGYRANRVGTVGIVGTVVGTVERSQTVGWNSWKSSELAMIVILSFLSVFCGVVASWQGFPADSFTVIKGHIRNKVQRSELKVCYWWSSKEMKRFLLITFTYWKKKTENLMGRVCSATTDQ